MKKLWMWRFQVNSVLIALMFTFIASLKASESQLIFDWNAYATPFGVEASNQFLPLFSQELQIPSEENGLIKTQNKGGGYMTKNTDSFASEFIDSFSENTGRILEIGAAYGNAVLRMLKQTKAKIIANDMEERNLLLLHKELNGPWNDRLFLHHGTFPEGTQFPEQSLDAVLVCRVFHFLRGEEIERGLELIFQWLKPGGKVAIIAATPFQKNIKTLIPQYYANLAMGDKWPGYIYDYAQRNEELKANLYQFLHVFDEVVLKRALEDQGFIVERVAYLDRKESLPTVVLDGREGIGIIAQKPL